MTVKHPDLAWARQVLLDAKGRPRPGSYGVTDEELDAVWWSNVMGCYMVHWKGMTLGIETDKCIHS